MRNAVSTPGVVTGAMDDCDDSCARVNRLYSDKNVYVEDLFHGFARVV